MPCIDPEGNVSENAKKILHALSEKPQGANELKDIVSKPIFIIRSTMRELISADLAIQEGDLYKITEIGKKKL